MRLRTTLLQVASAAFMLHAAFGPALASTIPMPAGSKSWIMVSGGDCDDDGQATVDRGHCIAAVSQLTQTGDIGHNVFQNYSIFANAAIGTQTMRGSVQSTGGPLAFLDMSMVDTYTLNSNTLPAGTVVPITVSFEAAGDLNPAGIFSNSGTLLGFGGGTFSIRIGDTFNPSPIVIPENVRVSGPFGPTASASFVLINAPSTATIPMALTANQTLDVTIGTPFNLAFYVGARSGNATIDFSHTAVVSFAVPSGTSISSTGGFAGPTAVTHKSWGALKAHYR